MKVAVVRSVAHFHPHGSNFYYSALLLALVLLCAAVTSPAQEPKPEQKSAANIPAQPQPPTETHQLVIEDKNRLPCVYYYGQGGTQNYIYFSQSDYDQVNQRKDLNRVIFYLAPLPEIDTVELKRNANAAQKIEVESAGKKVVLKQVKLPGIPLLTDERILAAVREINGHYKLKGEAAVSPEQIRLAPYRSLEVIARSKSGPTLGTARVDYTQGQERFFRIDLVGTDDELKQFVEDPTFTVRFQSHGYIPKINELNVSLQLFFNEGFHHFLTGEADFKAWQKASTSNNAKGISLPPYLFKRSSNGEYEASQGLKSWVTRDQALEVISAFTTYIRVSRIIEFKDTTLVNITQDITKALLQEKDKATVFFRANVDQGNKITFHVLDHDLAPDLLADIGQKTILKNKAELNKNVSVTCGGTDKGTTAKVDQKSDNDDTLEFDTKGSGTNKIFVPKSIKLYQVALNSLASTMKWDVKDIRMTFVNNVPQSTPCLYVGYQHKTMRAVLKHNRRVNGKELKLVDGDHCIGIADGEPADISFQTTTSHSKHTIDIRIEFMVKETNDETTYKANEIVSFPVGDEWEVVGLEGKPTMSYAVTNQKLLIREKSFKHNFVHGVYNFVHEVVREVNASEIQFTRNEKGDPGTYIPTLANPKNTRGGGPLSKALAPVDLKGTHLNSFILKLDTSDSGGKKEVVAAAIGYDLEFDIPYRAVRRVVASEPEHLKKLLAEAK